MKKFLTLVLLTAVVCSCVFAGTFSLSAKAGWDSTNFAINLGNLKFALYDVDEVLEAKLNKDPVEPWFSDEELKLDGIDLDDYAKRLAILTWGPSFTLDAEFKFNNNLVIGADASYMIPVLTTIEGANLLDGLAEDYLAIPGGVHINALGLTLGRVQLDKIVDKLNDSIPADSPFDFAFGYNWNAIKAHAGVGYNFDCKTAPFSFTTKLETAFSAVLLNADAITEDTDVATSYNIKANFLDFGLAAEVGAKYNFNRTVALSLDALCDCGMFNVINGSCSIKEIEGGDFAVDYSFKAFSFALAPSFSARAGVVVKF